MSNPPEVAATVPAETSNTTAGPKPWLWAAAALAGGFFAGALLDIDRTPPGIGAVRLDDLTAEFYASALRTADTPEETARSARDWGLRLEAALDSVAVRNDIVLLPMASVAAGATDYTGEVRAAMRRTPAGDHQAAALEPRP